MKALARHLAALTPAARKALADKAGVSLRVLACAAGGRPVGVDSYLRLCNAAGIDPAPDLPKRKIAIGAFDHGTFALGINLRRRLNRHSERQAARAARIAPCVLYRAENRHPVSIENTLKLCRYLGVHPTGYVAAGFTGNNGGAAS